MSAQKRKPITKHSIGVVARRTGLKPDVIRAWERRYKAIEPGRTDTNRRYYSDEQIERLLLLRQATLGGRQISQVSHLSSEELKQLVAEDQQAIARAPRPVTRRTTPASDAEGHLSAALAAIENLDAQQLRVQLERCAVDLSPRKIIESVLVPLLDEIGRLWQDGELRVIHEHMASAVISSFLTNLQSTFAAPPSAPQIIVGTPSRQYHELGALMAAAAASGEGWSVTYLGASLPAEELAAAAHQRSVSAVALSLVYPSDDPLLSQELKKLLRLLDKDVALLLGGRAAPAYLQGLAKDRIHAAGDLAEFRELLRKIRSG